MIWNTGHFFLVQLCVNGIWNIIEISNLNKKLCKLNNMVRQHKKSFTRMHHFGNYSLVFDSACWGHLSYNSSCTNSQFMMFSRFINQCHFDSPRLLLHPHRKLSICMNTAFFFFFYQPCPKFLTITPSYESKWAESARLDKWDQSTSPRWMFAY